MHRRYETLLAIKLEKKEYFYPSARPLLILLDFYRGLSRQWFAASCAMNFSSWQFGYALRFKSCRECRGDTKRHWRLNWRRRNIFILLPGLCLLSSMTIEDYRVCCSRQIQRLRKFDELFTMDWNINLSVNARKIKKWLEIKLKMKAYFSAFPLCLLSSVFVENYRVC